MGTRPQETQAPRLSRCQRTNRMATSSPAETLTPCQAIVVVTIEL
ncbi:hypothetical protein ACLQ29_08670 [Micromonospora sp. DT228]